ncbi:MAG TPA: carboxypeptidase regulatory-like domain-containing protein [Ktedonobacteraceae bacterium]|nr:carboxypeptidase regulatory-like domain-containing protein [Ktedonobacteraceae bacterium]
MRSEFHQGSASRTSDPGNVASASGTQFISPLMLVQENSGSPGDLANQSTTPQLIAATPQAPVTPHPPVLSTYPDIADRAVSRLSEAAHLISEGESPTPNRRLPRASRLSPFHDISADIRRESTPLPNYSKMKHGAGTRDKSSTPDEMPAAKVGSADRNFTWRDGDDALPDFWPWLDTEAEEKENEDTWANSTDPLISRHAPNSSESARIEEEDIKRALAEGVPTQHNLARVLPRRPSLRVAFAILAILAAIAIVVDGVLFSIVVIHPHQVTKGQVVSSAPSLTFSSTQVSVGQTGSQTVQVQVHIANFKHDSSVQLSHNVQEVVKTTINVSGMVNLRSDGSADVTITIDNSWEPGPDMVAAEGTTTHYTATAVLVVLGKPQSTPAHLQIKDQNNKPVTDKNVLDFGTGIVGSDTIKPLQLSNTGNGTITWSANSDQPWLLVSPGQGMFSLSQTIEVAVQRTGMKPRLEPYTGKITIVNSVGASQSFEVEMVVSALPANPGPVLVLSPAVLSFTTIDGSSPNPNEQMVTLTNPGNQSLKWSLGISNPATGSTQSAGVNNWLSVKLQPQGTSITSSSIIELPAGGSQQLYVSVNSLNLLPGAYLGELAFSAQGALDPSQQVSVSLTIQPHCGVVTAPGYLSFSAVLGGTLPANQSLGVNATASCAGQSISWNAAISYASSAASSWLSATPLAGTLKGTTSEFLSIGVNTTNLKAGTTYYGFIALTTPKITQTVMVTLIVQSPQATVPVMVVAPLNLNFSNTQGQPNPKGQVVTITNSGKQPLLWKTNQYAFTCTWFCSNPSGGPLQPGQTAQLIVNINTFNLPPGTYAGLITLSGTDSSGKVIASGSGQVVSVNLVVQPPCTLTQPSSSSLAFSAVQGSGNDPISQTLLISGTGNCAWPLTLTVGKPTANWLIIPQASGNIQGTGQSASFSVDANPVPNTGALAVGVYNASFSISAVDNAGNVAQSSPQTIAVTFTVLPPPCVASYPTGITLTATQGQSSTAQNVLLSASGTCTRPITWTATGNSSWLVLPPSLASDTGNGSTLAVSANSSNLSPGTYTATISITATDSNGLAVQNTLPIPVTLTVMPTYTVSGTVLACLPGPAPTCTTSAPLPGATLLLTSSGATVATVTADASGNYSFAGLTAGTYSVAISGTISGTSYASTDTITVTGNMTNNLLDVYPG